MIRRIQQHWHRGRRSRGQIIIFVAAFAVVMVGMIGLSIDLGYSFAQKRATQNAADAAAIAGTRAVTEWSTTNTTIAAWPDVNSVVQANDLGNATQQISCHYVDDAGANLGRCDQPVPDTTTGISVEVTETHSTFFMQIIPGAPNTVTTRASATAHAQIVPGDVSGAPFILCGASAKLLNGGGSIPIVIQNGSSYDINPAAIGQTFEIHGSQIDDCGLASSRYKGLADGTKNAGKTVPDWFYGYEGVRAGPANEMVAGVQGCQIATQDPFNCVMYVPIATDNPPPQKLGSDNLFYIVAYATFEISDCSSPCQHQATLIGKYIVQAPSGLPAWTPGSWARGENGVIAIRLTQ